MDEYLLNVKKERYEDCCKFISDEYKFISGVSKLKFMSDV